MANTFIPVATQAPTNTNTDATLTLTAPTNGSRWVIGSIIATYSGTPTAGALTVVYTIASTQYTETYYISAGGVTHLNYLYPKRFPPNVGVTITLVAAGAVKGTLYSDAWTE